MNAATTLRRPGMGPLDRTVLAVGTALVAWSRRAERTTASPPSAARDASDLRELHHLRRTADTDQALILARRSLGANQLLR